MNEFTFQNQISDQILEAYFKGSSAELSHIAKKHGVALAKLETEWRRLVWISQTFKEANDLQPSQLTINKILAHARASVVDEHSTRKLGFLTQWFLPTSAFASVVVVAILGFLSLQTLRAPLGDSMPLVRTEVLDSTTVANSNDTTTNNHQLMTPLDLRQNFAPSFSAPAPHYGFMGPGALASPVSLGATVTKLAVDETLDHKILSGSVLNDKDLETLFFRARESEHQGEYQNALKDYQFIVNFYPASANQKTIQLAIANCLQSLQEKGLAIQVLQKIQDTYGASDDVAQRIDELKSVSF